MIDWIDGDLLGFPFPAHTEALRSRGAAFLTDAFRATGTLTADNRVTRITQFEESHGGSTGRKLLLSVELENPSSTLQPSLFVKFSRDFDDAIRDRARFQMEAEVRLGLLSRSPAFPIAVPTCYYADFHQQSGSGILITARIPFGSKDIEEHRGKCLDYEMPQQFEHYQAILRALAGLAGTHASGKLGDDVGRHFPLHAASFAVNERAPYTPAQIKTRVLRYIEFAATYPRLLPANIRAKAFTARLTDEAPRLILLQSRLREILSRHPEYIALCHWNANIDNAWFTRTSTGLECGLLDWGHVGQMNIAMSLWGCLSGAELNLWDTHLDELLSIYVAEFETAGGTALDTLQLKTHLQLYALLMGLNWLLDVPQYLARLFPDLSEFESRFEPQLKQHEAARSQLHMMTVFLNLWQKTNINDLLYAVDNQQ